MSSSYDERVVSMKFDNKNFESNVKESMGTLDKLKEALHFKGAKDNFKQITKASEEVNFAAMERSLASLEKRFSTFGIVGMRIVENLTDSMMGFAKNTLGFVTNKIVEGGKKRATNVENARFQLQGLLKDDAKVEAVMQNAKDSVTDTAYAYDEAAKAASQFAATGIQAGEEMTMALKGVTGVAAVTNSQYEDIARIFTTVAGNGRMMGDQLLQLGSRGLAVTEYIAKFMNDVNSGSIETTDKIRTAVAEITGGLEVTGSEVRQFTSDGLISFDIFSEAMGRTFGDQAFKANETFNGALSNIGAALARTGEMFYAPLIEQNGELVQMLNAIRIKINAINKLLPPLAGSFSEGAKKIFRTVTGFFERLDLGGLPNVIEKLAGATTKAFDVLNSVLTVVFDAIEKFFSALPRNEGVMKNTIEFVTSAAKKAADLGETAEKVTGQISDGLEQIDGLAKQAMVGVFGNGDERRRAIEGLGASYEKVQNRINELLGVSFRYEEAQNAVTEAVEGTSESSKDLRSELKELRDNTFKTKKEKAFGNLTDTFSGLISLVKIAARSVKAFVKVISPVGRLIKGIAGLVLAITGAIGRVITKIDGLTESSDIFGKVAETVASVLDRITDVGSGLVDLFGFGIKRVFNVLDSGRNKVKEFFDAFKETAAFERIASGIQNFISGIKELTGNVAGKAVENVKSLSGFEFKIPEIDVKKLAQGLSDKLEWIMDNFEKAKEKVLEFVNGFKDEHSEKFASFSDILGGLKDRLSEFFGLFSSENQSNLDNTVNIVKGALNPFEKIGEIIKSAREKAGNFLTTLTEFISGNFGNPEETGTKIAEGLRVAFEKIKEVLNNIDLDKVLSVAKFGSMLYFVLHLVKFIDSLKGAVDGFAEIPGSIVGTIESLGGALQAYQDQLKYDSVLKVAQAIGIVAASIIALTFVDTQKLTNVVVALMGLIFVIKLLVDAFAKMGASLEADVKDALNPVETFTKGITNALSKGINLAAIGLAAAGIGAAVILIAKAIGVLSEIDILKGLKAIAGITLIIGGLIVAAVALDGVKLDVKTGASIVALSIALRQIANVITQFADLSIGNLLAGVGAVIGMMGMFAVLARVSQGNQMLSFSVGMLMMAAALTAMIIPITILGNMPFATMIDGIQLLLMMLAELAVFSVIVSGKMDAGVTLLLMAAAITVLSTALTALGVTAPLALAGLVPLTAALVLFVAVGALATLVAPGLYALAIAVGTVSVSFLLIGAGVKLFAIGVAAFAAAAVAFSAALPVVADNVANFGKVVTERGPELAAGFATVILGIAAAISATAPVLGAAAAMVVTSFLLSLLAAAAMVLGPVVQGLAQLLVAALVVLANTIRDNTDVILYAIGDVMAAIINFVLSALQGLFEEMPFIGDKISFYLEEAKKGINDIFDVEEGKKATTEFVNGLTSGVEESMPNVETSGNNLGQSFMGMLGGMLNPESGAGLMSNFTGGMSDQLSAYGPEGTQKVADLGTMMSDAFSMNGMVDSTNLSLEGMMGSLGQYGIEIPNAAGLMGENSVYQIDEALSDLPGVADEHMGDYTHAINDNIPQVENAAQNVADSTVLIIEETPPKRAKGAGRKFDESYSEGIKSSKELVNSAAEDLANSAVEKTNKYNEMYNTGAYSGQGLVDGLYSKIDHVARAAGSLAQTAANYANITLEVRSPSRVFMRTGEYAGEGLSIGLLNMADLVKQSASRLGISATNGLTSSIRKIDDIVSSDVDASPVIRPVMDFDQLKSDAKTANSIVNSTDMQGKVNSFKASINGNVEIANKTAESMKDSNVNTFKQILGAAETMAKYMAEVRDNTKDTQIVMDSGELVGSISGKIGADLATSSRRSARHLSAIRA